MFFQGDRMDIFRNMILARNTHERAEHLLRLLPMQQQDFLQIFRLLRDTQVTIRLLDPPLHEFLPNPAAPDFEDQLNDLSTRLNIPLEQCQDRMRELQESNPMMGFRGCRLSIVYPEITEMQTKAIVGAAVLARKEGLQVQPQIMIPFIVSDHEIDMITPIIASAASLVCNQLGNVFTPDKLQLSIGAMIETPRACIRAERIAAAENMSFVSIGTNDLTQLVFGFSRDDCQQFLPHYLEKGLLSRDPFVSVDLGGLGALIEATIRRIHRGKPGMKVGVCGEHAGDPYSINLFEQMGIDYISCSPYRIPIAKVAAAQAHIRNTANEKPQSRTEMMQKFMSGQETF
jgi:pyruvate,orthophosphate dikinase